MSKIITILLLFCSCAVLGQTSYRFSKDILADIVKDTVSWKYQTGATALSFSGYYSEVLATWDKNGIRKPKSNKQDSLFYLQSRKLNAKTYILNKAKDAAMLIINEAHHLPQHRSFTNSLLKDLYKQGYRYLGLEALFGDTAINKRGFAIESTGYYTQEPEFGNLIANALKLGFVLFGYEASQGKNGKEREIEQALNIQQFIKQAPPGKVIIHCGYAHAYENDYPAWGKAMAGRLKDSMGIDPLTVDQTAYLERSNPSYNSIFINLNKNKEAVVLLDTNGQVFNKKQTDIIVLHPATSYNDKRPYWQTIGKTKYRLPSSKLSKARPVLVLAYRKNEYNKHGIPADLIEIENEQSPQTLYLQSGSYTIVVKDKDYQVIERYDITIK